ncbi:MAG TPA: outer membrane lipoprotein carrier protein LolA [Salinimicrobium sp.]|nr:outer membrane lipoprotein carrier protein LolA [Salinimicrobium sp.]
MKRISLLLAFFTVMVSGAQNADKAKQLLDEVSAKVEGYENVQLDFKYSLENPSENVDHETRGDVSLKGEKYLLNIMGTTRIFDGKKVYTIIPENEEVNISTYHPDDDKSLTPSRMLTFYKDGYNYAWDIMQDVKGRKIQYIKLTPKDKNSEIKNILLGIDKQTKNIYNLIQTQKDGSVITITVSSFKTDQPLPETLFEFREDRYKDYYINRLD